MLDSAFSLHTKDLLDEAKVIYEKILALYPEHIETLNLFEKYNIVDCKKYINDFYDTAAILKNMDLVITIDSSIVHLAGALGVKTYLMLPASTEWRWFQDNESTLWYNSVKVFKQKQQAHWSDVILRIKKNY